MLKIILWNACVLVLFQWVFLDKISFKTKHTWLLLCFKFQMKKNILEIFLMNDKVGNSFIKCFEGRIVVFLLRSWINSLRCRDISNCGFNSSSSDIFIWNNGIIYFFYFMKNKKYRYIHYKFDFQRKRFIFYNSEYLNTVQTHAQLVFKEWWYFF